MSGLNIIGVLSAAFLRRFIVVLILLITATSTAYSREQSAINDSLMTILDRMVVDKPKYDDPRKRRIDSLRQQVREVSPAATERLIKLNNELYDAFFSYECDSMLKYLNRNLVLAEQTRDKALYNLLLLRKSYALTALGDFSTSLHMLRSVNREELNSEHHIEWLNTMIYVYNNVAHNSKDEAFSTELLRQARLYQDTLLLKLSANHPLAMENLESRYRSERSFDEAFAINDTRLYTAPSGTVAHASIAFDRSLLYEMTGHEDKRLEWLIRSAMSDIECSIKDNASIALIAGILSTDENEIGRSYSYITSAMDDANMFNSPLRHHQIADMFRVIERAHDTETSSQHRVTKILFTLCAVLLIAAIATALWLLKMRNRQRAMSERLNKLNSRLSVTKQRLIVAGREKDSAIRSFIELCSSNITKFEEFRSKVYARVKNKKYSDLDSMFKGGNISRQEVEELTRNFDKAFCSMYPTFVDSFNSMLRPECCIIPKEQGRLTPELRIFALIRLGINDFALIAQLLHYSLSTIYNYRVKVRKCTRPEIEDIETAIMAIDAAE